MLNYMRQVCFTLTFSAAILQSPFIAFSKTDLSVRSKAIVCINFNDYELLSYGGSTQDIDVTQHETKNAGMTLHLWGNNWKAIKQSYLVTPYTVIEFDFYSDGDEGGINSIGIDEDLNFGTKRQRRTRRSRRRQAEAHFQIHGTDIFGHQTFHDDEQGQWRHYTIPIGQKVRGRMRCLVLGNDADSGQATSVHYRSIVIYEDRDGDRLPDNWEIQHFGDLNQTADDDLDADEVTHRREYEAGTDPKDDMSPYIPLIQGHLYGLTWNPPPANTPNLVEMIYANTDSDPVALAQLSLAQPKGAASFLIRGWDPFFMIFPQDRVQTPDGELTPFRSPWLATAATKTQTHFNEFMAAFKNAGGVVDSIVLDLEKYLSNWTLEKDPRVFTLAAGQHTLRIKEKSPDVKLDKILITEELNPQNDIRRLTPNEKIWIEAEDAVMTGVFTTATDSNASSQSYLTIPNGSGDVLDDPSQGSYAEYVFNLPMNGYYHILAKTLTNDDADDSVYISIDNGPPHLWAFAHGGGQWWLWDKPSDGQGFIGPRWYLLTAGQHTLRITQREDGVKIDQFLITNDADYMPHPILSGGKTKMWIEAEKTTVIRSPMAIASSKDVFGGQYVHTPIGTGDNPSPLNQGAVEYQFDISTSTTRDYYLWARVLGASDGGSSFWISVDNGSWVQWDTFASNTAWQWRPFTVNSASFGLLFNAGEHLLKIKYRDAGVSIDKLLITDDPSFTPSNMVPTEVIVEAEDADVLNPPMEIGQDDLASKGGFIYVSNSSADQVGYADYTFKIPKTGDYYIKGQFKTPSGPLGTWRFDVQLDGSEEIIEWFVEHITPTARLWKWITVAEPQKQHNHIFAIRNDPRSGPLNTTLGFSTDRDYELVSLEHVGASIPDYVLDQDDLGQFLLQNDPEPQFVNWSAVVQGISSQFLHRAFYVPANRHYPKVKVSNYDDRMIAKEQALPELTRIPEYSLSSFGTHQSDHFYGHLGDLRHRDVLQPDGTFKKFGTRPFAALLLECNQIRAGLRSARRAWQPWIPRKNWGVIPDPKQVTFYAFQNSDMYNEVIYHLALSGTEDFLYWNSFPTIGDPMADDLLVDQLLTELNQKFASQIRQPVTPDKIPWSSTAVVSGTQLGNDSILWRASVPEGTLQVKIQRLDVVTQALISEQIIDLNGTVGTWVETRIGEKIHAESL